MIWPIYLCLGLYSMMIFNVNFINVHPHPDAILTGNSDFGQEHSQSPVSFWKLVVFTRVVSYLARSDCDTPNITWVVARISRTDTPKLLWRPPTNRKAERRPQVFKCMCTWHVKSGRCVKSMNPKNTKKITDSWECRREHNLWFWWWWHQPFRSCQSNTRLQTYNRFF